MDTNRTVIRLDPGMWIAWEMGNGDWFHGQIHRSWFEVPAQGRLLGMFREEPSEEALADMKELLASVAERQTQEA